MNNKLKQIILLIVFNFILFMACMPIVVGQMVMVGTSIEQLEFIIHMMTMASFSG